MKKLIFLSNNTKKMFMNEYTHISLLNRSRKYPFAFNTVCRNNFLTLTKLWYSTSSPNNCSSFIRLYEFKRIFNEVLFECIFIAFEEAAVSARYKRVLPLIFGKIIQFINSASVLWPVYSFKNSKKSINIACVFSRRMIFTPTIYFVHERS